MLSFYAPSTWNHLLVSVHHATIQFFQIFLEKLSLFKNLSFSPIAMRYMCVCVVCVCLRARGCACVCVSDFNARDFNSRSFKDTSNHNSKSQATLKRKCILLCLYTTCSPSTLGGTGLRVSVVPSTQQRSRREHLITVYNCTFGKG